MNTMWSKSEVLSKDYQVVYKESRPNAQGEEYQIDTRKGMIPWKHLLRPKKYMVSKDTGWGKIAWACREARNNGRGGRLAISGLIPAASTKTKRMKKVRHLAS